MDCVCTSMEVRDGTYMQCNMPCAAGPSPNPIHSLDFTATQTTKGYGISHIANTHTHKNAGHSTWQHTRAICPMLYQMSAVVSLDEERSRAFWRQLRAMSYCWE